MSAKYDLGVNVPRKGVCPNCGHPWSQHDPEDGTCDAHRSDGGFGVCPCGRESVFLTKRRLVAARKAKVKQ